MHRWSSIARDRTLGINDDRRNPHPRLMILVAVCATLNIIDGPHEACLQSLVQSAGN